MVTRSCFTSARRWYVPFLTTTVLGLSLNLNPIQAQTLIPSNDGTGTQVIPDGDRFDIDGGSLSGDGQNLFHSFDRFDLNSGETANFLTSPEIRNVLGRIGGDASQINGLLQLTGSAANLYLLNPAGILFGANAQLNLPASFFATSASALTFNGGIFDQINTPDYQALTGDPSGFQFNGGGAITSLAPLQVPETLGLLGGEVNTSAPLSAGQLLIQAIPGEATLRISQPGFVLSLDLSDAPAQPTDVPGLLTGGDGDGGETILDTSGDVPRIQSGNVAIGNVTLQNASPATSSEVVIEAGGSLSTGSINTSTGAGGNPIRLQADGDINTQILFSGGGAITVDSASGSIQTGDVTATGVSGGDITLNAAGNLTSGNLDSEGLGGSGGNITTVTGGEAQILSVDGRGTTSGGNLSLTQSRLRIPGAVASGLVVDEDVSLATSEGGSIRVELTEFGVPFEVGNPTTSGTSGSLTAGGDRLDPPFVSTPGTISQGAITVISPEAPEPVPRPQDSEAAEDIERLQRIPGQDSDSVMLLGSSLESEVRYTDNFVEFLGLDITPALSLDDSRALLAEIEEDTGERPALIYLQFVSNVQLSLNPSLQKQAGSGLLNIEDDPLSDGLEMLVVTSAEEPVRVVVDGATRSQVMEAAFELRSNLTNPRLRRSNRYLAWSQELYDLLIRPLETALEEQEITNLTFISDTGLRTLPLGVLHDGEEFLIERYNLGLIPSLSLTDTRRGNLQQTQVLAMGASIFPFNDTLSPLPAVSTELQAISEQIWPGINFLNEDFTIENLRRQRQQTPYGIIHLATHGEFLDGDATNSYIQFWDERLSLLEMRRLNLNRPPVELLVLSACRTAVGSAEAELGFAGLAVASGAKTALGSLWYVSDDGTLGLMTEFYQQLRNSSTRSEALRQAQIALLNGEVRVEEGQLITPEFTLPLPPELAEQIPDRDFSHPYFWSAFSLVGNPW
ncbi:CHAT domain-containing protein [Sodalinema gerasimenkoae]|uniref:CHAT domain-containing protein n=1 Tax=Sodalinema gerasimenkoae TaxID=2862348 RepID=UPI00135AAEFA|nr:CHAT domain-containing protein [Sodalinema gerasimenkoae]